MTIVGGKGPVKEVCFTAHGVPGRVDDSPVVFSDCRKIRSLGRETNVTILVGVLRTPEYLYSNSWLFDTSDAQPPRAATEGLKVTTNRFAAITA